MQDYQHLCLDPAKVNLLYLSGDLPGVIERKLLVVQLPPNNTEVQDGLVFVTPADTIEPNNGPSRASAGILLESLDDIIGECKDKVGYLCAERSRSGLPIIHAAPSLGNRGSRAAMQLWRWPFHRVGVGGQTSWSPDTGTMAVRCMTVRSPGELTLRIYRSAFYYGL
ncbi:hypothetical protein F4824DRAFT_251815 [Ustulina deusta]|nr:hypothetical protein F4824DRAFT_251815 [Ustulina deusta]